MKNQRRWRRVLAVVGLLALASVVVALVASPGLRAALRLTPGFQPLAADARVYHQEGAEELATRLAAALPGAVAAVEEGHGLPFVRPFRVYVPASHASGMRRVGQGPGSRVRGFALVRDVWISPLAFEFEGRDTHRESLAHELSHLHVYQQLGKRRQLRDVPTWFSEGLADWVSGTGTEVVSREEARRAILAGHALVPDTRGRLPWPKTASDYGLTYPMLHCQSLLFVEFLEARDSVAFRAFVVAVLQGEGFVTAFRSHLGEDLTEAWQAFVAALGEPADRAAARSGTVTQAMIS